VAAAAGLAILASLYILVTPVNVQIITASAVSGGSEIARETNLQQSWYQVQCPWGVIVLMVFSSLFSWGYYLARKEAYTRLGGLNLGLLSITYLAGFSIGPRYLPAVLFLLLGTGLLIISRNRTEAR